MDLGDPPSSLKLPQRRVLAHRNMATVYTRRRLVVVAWGPVVLRGSLRATPKGSASGCPASPRQLSAEKLLDTLLPGCCIIHFINSCSVHDASRTPIHPAPAASTASTVLARGEGGASRLGRKASRGCYIRRLQGASSLCPAQKVESDEALSHSRSTSHALHAAFQRPRDLLAPRLQLRP